MRDNNYRNPAKTGRAVYYFVLRKTQLICVCVCFRTSSLLKSCRDKKQTAQSITLNLVQYLVMIILYLRQLRILQSTKIERTQSFFYTWWEKNLQGQRPSWANPSLHYEPRGLDQREYLASSLPHSHQASISSMNDNVIIVVINQRKMCHR